MVEAGDFTEKIALLLSKEVQYSCLINLPANIVAQNPISAEGNVRNSLGENDDQFRFRTGI